MSIPLLETFLGLFLASASLLVGLVGVFKCGTLMYEPTVM
jgi:hypothetical protein